MWDIEPVVIEGFTGDCHVLMVVCRIFQGEKEGGEDGTTPAPGGGGDKKLTNQFNYSERASQTYNNPYRVKKMFL